MSKSAELLLPNSHGAEASGGGSIGKVASSQEVVVLTSSLDELDGPSISRTLVESREGKGKKGARSKSEVKRQKSNSDSYSVKTVKTDSQKYHFPTVVELNVGGTCFTTTLATLRKFPHSYLGKMFTSGEGLIRDNFGRFFIDRDPALFAVFLNFLRTGRFVVPPGQSANDLIEESLFYNFEGLDFPVTMNVADQFRNINLKVVRPSFDKLWPIIQKRMKIILENEPAYAAEIEWGPKASTHNSVHKVEAFYNADWTVTKCYIKIEISWKEEEILRPCSCVENWVKYLADYGFRTQVVSFSQLRMFW